MSKETSGWLNTQVLIGFTEKRGRAWHYRESEQGVEPNHYPQAIPVGDIGRRLFGWKGVPVPVFVPDLADPTKFVQVPDRMAWRRSDDGYVMGIHTTGYAGHQYEEWLLETVATILNGTLSVGSAGLLRLGAQAWVSVEVPDNFTTPEGVEHRPSILATTSFDGSLATQFKKVEQIVVCDNTMHAGLLEKGQEFKVKHTANSAVRIKDAREALALIETTADEFAAEVARLCQISVSDAQWKQFLTAHTELKPSASDRSKSMASTKRAVLDKLYTHDMRVAPWAGTAFGVLQAVNTYRHHEGTVRGAERAERNMTNAVTNAGEKADTKALGQLAAVLAA